MKYLGGIFIALAALGILFMGADCVSGETRYLECTVASHTYHPSWDEVVVHHSDDTTYVTLDHHPEEFWLAFDITGEPGTLSMEVREATYTRYHNNDYATVRVKVGRWTGHRYALGIEP